jgi:hypothetical protein
MLGSGEPVIIVITSSPGLDETEPGKTSDKKERGDREAI